MLLDVVFISNLSLIYVYMYFNCDYNFSTFTASKPEKYILLRMLSSVTAKWQVMGGLLGVDSNTIDGLSYSNFADEVKMSKMLQSWLDNEPTPATWGNIISVVEGPLQKKTLAYEMCKFLGIESGLLLFFYCGNIHATIKKMLINLNNKLVMVV